MFKSLTKFGFILALSASIISCSEEKDTSKKPKPSQEKSFWDVFNYGQKQSIATLKVIGQDSSPIAGAQVLIGNSADLITADQVLTTDKNGELALPDSWTGSESLTIDAQGFVRVTYYQITKPEHLEVQMKPLSSEVQYELAGKTQNLPISDGDGKVDFGLVMSALNKDALTSFELNKVISSEMDKITALGQDILIPSNVSLPRQKESYFLPITLEKPMYRLYFGTPGMQRVYAARGRFPFKSVVDQFRDNKKFYELINYFSITGGSVRDILINNQKSSLDIPVTDLTYSNKLNLQAPQFDSREIVIGVAIKNMNGYLIPTDVKRLSQNQKMPLAVDQANDALVLSVMKHANEMEPTSENSSRMSAVLLPFNDGLTPDFLPQVENPKVNSETSVEFKSPKNIDGVNALATFSALSTVVTTQKGDSTSKRVTRLWEVYAPSWVEKIELPNWKTQVYDMNENLADAVSTKKRWEVTFLGSANKLKTELGSKAIEDSTHATHSSVEF